jgi:hypothetical protein
LLKSYSFCLINLKPNSISDLFPTGHYAVTPQDALNVSNHTYWTFTGQKRAKIKDVNIKKLSILSLLQYSERDQSNSVEMAGTPF